MTPAERALLREAALLAGIKAGGGSVQALRELLARCEQEWAALGAEVAPSPAPRTPTRSKPRCRSTFDGERCGAESGHGGMCGSAHHDWWWGDPRATLAPEDRPGIDYVPYTPRPKKETP